VHHRLPASSNKAKMRLINGLYGNDGGITLTVDYTALANSVTYPTASVYANVNASSTARIDVSSPLSVVPIYSASDVNLVSSGVYTMFVLGEQGAAPGILRRDR
jgi:hypothetical protein